MTKEEVKQYNHERYLRNKEKYIEANNKWRAANREKCRAYNKNYRMKSTTLAAKRRAYYEEHKEEIIAKNRERYLRHREEILAAKALIAEEHKRREELRKQAEKEKQIREAKAREVHICKQMASESRRNFDDMDRMIRGRHFEFEGINDLRGVDRSIAQYIEDVANGLRKQKKARGLDSSCTAETNYFVLRATAIRFFDAKEAEDEALERMDFHARNAAQVRAQQAYVYMADSYRARFGCAIGLRDAVDW